MSNGGYLGHPRTQAESGAARDGAAGMSHGYTDSGTDEAESIRTLHRALELGVTLIDTAEIYGSHTNEELLGRALKGRHDQPSVHRDVRDHPPVEAMHPPVGCPHTGWSRNVEVAGSNPAGGTVKSKSDIA